MKQSIKKTLGAMLVVPLLALGVSAFVPAVSQPAYAEFDQGIGDGASAAQGTSQQGVCIFTDGTGAACNNDIFKTITNILLFLIGAVSVIMLIIGGIRYTVSGGDSAAVTSAKNTILYAIVGLVVAILAFAIVNFVVGSFVK